jgi:haloacetate dehalogenase
MTGVVPNSGRAAWENALERRTILRGCLGVVATGMAVNGPAFAQPTTASPMNFFPGFRRQTIQTSGATVNVLVGGSGPPVLLLHGYPQTHVEWRKMAPVLAKNYTLL